MKKINLLFTFITCFIFHSTVYSQFNPSDPIETDFTPIINGEQMLNTFTYDFNNDGNLDVVLDGGMYYPQSSLVYPGKNSLLLLGNGDGSFDQSNVTLVHNSNDIYNNLGISDFADYN